MAGRLPDAAVMTFAVLSVALLMGTGVRMGVSRKTRTSFRGADGIEDSKLGNQTRYRVVTRAEETNGEAFTVELTIREGAYGADRGSQPAHLHTDQDEQLDVKRGRLGYWRGHASLAAEVGAADDDATVVIAHGEAHSIWNAGGPGGGDLVVDVTLRPAGAGEAFLETLAGLGYEYETARAVSPLQTVLTYHRCGAVLTGWPRWAWALAVEWVVPLAEGLGYRATYPEYRTLPPAPGAAGAADAAKDGSGGDGHKGAAAAGKKEDDDAEQDEGGETADGSDDEF